MDYKIRGIVSLLTGVPFVGCIIFAIVTDEKHTVLDNPLTYVLLIPTLIMILLYFGAFGQLRIISLNQKVTARVFSCELFGLQSRYQGPSYLIGVTYEYKGESYRRFFTCDKDFTKDEEVELYVHPRNPHKLAMKGKIIYSSGRFQPIET